MRSSIALLSSIVKGKNVLVPLLHKVCANRDDRFTVGNKADTIIEALYGAADDEPIYRNGH